MDAFLRWQGVVLDMTKEYKQRDSEEKGVVTSGVGGDENGAKVGADPAG